MSSRTTPRGVTSTGYVFLGAALGLLGLGIVLGAAGPDDSSALAVVGFVIGAVGGALLLVGLTAKGVALGMEEHRRSL